MKSGNSFFGVDFELFEANALLIILLSYFRAVVGDIIRIKQQSYLVIKPKGQTCDEFLDAYLEEQIVKLWPPGWMKKDELRSECDKR